MPSEKNIKKPYKNIAKNKIDNNNNYFSENNFSENNFSTQYGYNKNGNEEPTFFTKRYRHRRDPYDSSSDEFSDEKPFNFESENYFGPNYDQPENDFRHENYFGPGYDLPGNRFRHENCFRPGYDWLGNRFGFPPNFWKNNCFSCPFYSPDSEIDNYDYDDDDTETYKANNKEFNDKSSDKCENIKNIINQKQKNVKKKLVKKKQLNDPKYWLNRALFFYYNQNPKYNTYLKPCAYPNNSNCKNDSYYDPCPSLYYDACKKISQNATNQSLSENNCGCPKSEDIPNFGYGQDIELDHNILEGHYNNLNLPGYYRNPNMENYPYTSGRYYRNPNLGNPYFNPNLNNPNFNPNLNNPNLNNPNFNPNFNPNLNKNFLLTRNIC